MTSKGYKAQGKALPVMGVDSLVIHDAKIKQAKHARMQGKAHDNKKVYSFTLKGFFSLGVK